MEDVAQQGVTAALTDADGGGEATAAAAPAAPPTDVLRLRGLPFSADEDGVRAFFAGYDLKQVFLCKRGGGW